MGPGTGRLLIGAGIAAGATLVVDQATKAAARRELRPYEERALAFDGQVAVSNVPNYGSAYGLVPRMPAAVPALATAALATGFVLAGQRLGAHPLAVGIGAGLMVGGGIGNVLDRARQGYVTDVVTTGDAFGHYNLADVAITAGAITASAAVAAMLLRR